MKAATTLVILLLSPHSLRAQFLGDVPKDAVIGSAHDLRNLEVRQNEEVSACDICHSKAKATRNENLPWNQRVRGTYFVLYGRAPFSNADALEPTSTSAGLGSSATMMCLSCHEDSTAHSAFENTFYAEAKGVSGIGLLDPLSDHPVHFIYNAQLTREISGLQLPVEGSSLTVPYVGKRTFLPLFKQSPTDESGYMECATCHDPHNGEAKFFLRMNNSGSALCLNCHG